LTHKTLLQKRNLLITFTAVVVLSASIYAQEVEGTRPARKERFTKLRVEVVDDESSTPLENADVFVKLEDPDQEYEETIQTNRHGVASLPKVPRGTVFIQATAQGWTSSGKSCELTQAEQTAQIRLRKKPEPPGPPIDPLD